MNVGTPFPPTLVLNTSNISTEAARRDNLQRETIPQSSANERGDAERGLGSEGDRARQATGQFSSPLVYERPTVQTPSNGQGALSNANAANADGAEGSDRDNASDESAGRENAEEQQREQAEIRELEARDREVRAHEQAHAAVGGQYAGSPQYEFETGPDGQRYAVGGEVSIDISEENTPEETLRKMQQVRAAALAPADPSPQDLRVAAEAGQRANEAQADIIAESREAQAAENETPDASTISTPSLDDIIDEGQITTPRRTLDNVALNEDEEQRGALAQRRSTIAQFYQQAVTPTPAGFSASA